MMMIVVGFLRRSVFFAGGSFLRGRVVFVVFFFVFVFLIGVLRCCFFFVVGVFAFFTMFEIRERDKRREKT